MGERNNPDDATTWTQAFFQGQMYTETKSIHQRLDAIDKRFEIIDREEGNQWDTIGTVRKERSNCRECQDEKFRSMKWWSAVTSAIAMACAAITTFFFGGKSGP